MSEALIVKRRHILSGRSKGLGPFTIAFPRGHGIPRCDSDEKKRGVKSITIPHSHLDGNQRTDTSLHEGHEPLRETDSPGYIAPLGQGSRARSDKATGHAYPMRARFSSAAGFRGLGSIEGHVAGLGVGVGAHRSCAGLGRDAL